jgi:hypothetical protein
MTSLGKNAWNAHFLFTPQTAQPGCLYMPPSEGRLGVDKAVLFGYGNDHLGLGQFEFGRDLSALISVESVLEFSAQFLDVLFDGHRRLLMFEKDDAGIREGEAGSRIASATAGAARGGAEMRQHFGGTASLRPPLLSDTIRPI